MAAWRWRRGAAAAPGRPALLLTASPRPGRLRLTRRGETLRQGITKPIDEVLSGSGLAILVALQFFQASDWQKGMIAAAPFWGFLAAPLMVLAIAGGGWRVSKAMALFAGASAIGMFAAGLAPSIAFFIAGVTVVAFFQGLTAPLQTALWRQNVPSSLRGRLYGQTAILGMAAALVSSGLIALWLGDDAGRYRPIFLLMAAGLGVVAVVMFRMPSQPLPRRGHRNPLRVLALLWQNPIFGYLSLVWMFMGLGNLMTMPLRVEFAGSAERGLQLSAGVVVLMTLVLPEVAGMCAMRIWSRLFDRINFMILRMLINAFFFVSILVTFSGGLGGLVLGGLLFGIGKGGGQIAWNLWVTKFCEPERTADYMAVHTFLTGVRGILGGYLAFGFLSWGFDIDSVGYLGAGLILTATLLLIPVIRFGRREPSASGARG